MRRPSRETRSLEDVQLVEDQIVEQQKTVSYDTKEYTVGYLVQEFNAEQFYIPEYQRKFVWDPRRKSRFIESVILGLPIPFMFVAETALGKLEIVDGAQRIQTLQQFVADRLALTGLEKLSLLNGLRYTDLSLAQQRKFGVRSLRMVALSDTTDDETKRDLFERINTGSDELRHAELRKGAYAGPFYSLVQECAASALFFALCPMSQALRDRGQGEELVLRFFAYSEEYRQFKHSVRDFLNAFLKAKNRALLQEGDGNALRAALHERFMRMLHFVDRCFPYGFSKTRGSTAVPRVRFEAISVGVDLALEEAPNLAPADFAWLDSTEFQVHTTTHASNSPQKLAARVEYVRDALLGRLHADRPE